MSEIRALLLTDVVDSTRLAESLGDAAAAALGEAHDRVARDLLRAWRGREIDKTDGMLMLFESADDALAFAMTYHKALAGLPVPLKARAGLHVGAVILRTNLAEDVAHGAKPLEVEGIAKPIAARVMSLAQGGQTLLTADARAALGEAAVRVQSHGHWRIKGIAEPVELFEAGDDDAPFTPPPDSAKVYRVVRDGDQWLPVQQLRHSLPAERDAFVGRQQALVDLARRFDAGARLVSVLGIGGTGKTRLALRFARCWLGDFPGGAWFCDLSQARNVDGLVHAVAQGLDVPLGKDDPVVQLGHAIAGRGRCLVILDNFEQIVRHAEATLGRWLDRAVDARFLVTTREVLGLPGEEAVALAPLPTPDAAALFVQRAASTKFDFRAGPDDQAAIQQLVKLLDGLPLAIELAAARVRVMSPATLLSRMDQRFKLLAAMGGRQDRQATLRATFDWSWDLLSDAEKSALAQLSVFEGGFTLAAAEGLLDLSALPGVYVALDLVQSLVDKSFLQHVDSSRFHLLTSVQEYAAEQFRVEGLFPGGGRQGVAAAEARHARLFASWRADGKFGASVELENFIAALRRAEALGEVELAVSLLERAWAGLQQKGPFNAAVELAMRVLQMPGADVRARGRTWWIAADSLQHSGRGVDAYGHFETAAALFEQCSDRAGQARALRKLGDLDITQGRASRAAERLQTALTIGESLRDVEIQVDALTTLGNLAEAEGRIDDARRDYEMAIERSRRIGDIRREGAAEGNLAVLCSDQGLMAQALSHHQAALAAASATGNQNLQGNALCNIGMLQQLMGDSKAALKNLELALEVSRSIGNAVTEAVVLCNMGIVLEGAGDPVAALQRYESALALARVLGDRYLQGQFLGYLGLLHARQYRHEEALRCLDAGQSMMQDMLDRIGLAILMCSRAEASQLAGDAIAAQAAFRFARETADAVGVGQESELGMALTRLRERFDLTDT